MYDPLGNRGNLKDILLAWLNQRRIISFALLGIGALFLVFFVVAFTMVVTMKIVLLESFITLMPQKNLQGVNVLVVGIDDTRDIKRSDSLLVCHMDIHNQRVGVLSIPRDTRVFVEGLGKTKINHAYAHGGIKLAKKTVSDFLSLPLTYYFKINLNGVEKIIDELGGIDVNVSKDLYYVDQAGDLYIDIKKGKQHLSGKDAVNYLRFRQDNHGDIGRIDRQRTVLYELAKKISKGNLITTPKLMIKLMSNLETNMSIPQIMGLAGHFTTVFKNKNIGTVTVPGAIMQLSGVSYWKPDIVALDKVVDTVLLGFDKKKKHKVEKVATVDKKASNEKRRKVTLKEVKRIDKQVDYKQVLLATQKPMLSVEVLNGYGVPGQAQKLARTLKRVGFKVPWYTNAGSFDYKKTLVVDWKGNIEKVVALAHFLKINPDNIIVYDRPNKQLDVSIVLGSDWPSIYPNIKPLNKTNQHAALTKKNSGSKR